MIRNVKSSELEGIARLHVDSFQNHFLSILGIELLKNYYKEFIKNSIFLVSSNGENEIEGFIVAIDNAKNGRKCFIKTNRMKLCKRMISLCIRLDKLAWKRIVKMIKTFLENLIGVKKSQSYVLDIGGKKIGILSICVMNRCKGNGLSRSLINEFEQKAIREGFTYYTLDVYKSNKRAINFYESIGMERYGLNGNECYLKKDLIK